MLKFRLVPSEQRPTNIDHSALRREDNEVPNTANTIAQTTSIAPPPSKKNDLWMEKIPELLEYFPKRLQNRARILFMSLRNHMKIDEDNRIIYTTEDGTAMQGNSIIALMHYVITPLPPSKKQNRPFDLITFAKMLQKVGVPNNV